MEGNYNKGTQKHQVSNNTQVAIKTLRRWRNH